MISPAEMALRLVIAAVLGAVLGLDRGQVEPAAGPRTHALVSLGAALLLLVSSYGFTDALKLSHVVLDPSRVAAQVVSGIGFLGAGVILLRRNVVRNLTTAASIWLVAGVGLAVGAGLYLPAGVTTGLALVILAALKRLERGSKSLHRRRSVTVGFDSGARGVREIAAQVERGGGSCKYLRAELDNAQHQDEYELEVTHLSTDALLDLMQTWRELPGLRSMSVSNL